MRDAAVFPGAYPALDPDMDCGQGRFSSAVPASLAGLGGRLDADRAHSRARSSLISSLQPGPDPPSAPGITESHESGSDSHHPAFAAEAR